MPSQRAKSVLNIRYEIGLGDNGGEGEAALGAATHAGNVNRSRKTV